MAVCQLAKMINESPTLRLNEQARILRAKGEPVIHLGIGEPKNKTPISASFLKFPFSGVMLPLLLSAAR